MPIRISAASVRSRIYLLAVLTCVLLVSAAAAFLILVRHSESSLLTAAQSHLDTLARTLAQDYSGRSAWELGHSSQPALEAPQMPGSNQLLALMTSAVLQHEPGIEGGFYSTSDHDLLGYAFPTHPGPGPKTDIPVHERPAIIGLATKAATAGQLQTLRFAGPRDATLFAAYPISIHGRTVGAAWMMQRMPGLNTGATARLLSGMIAFALGALACAFIAFLVVAEVQTAVHSIASYLAGLGANLSTGRPQPLKLAEFESVLREIDTLAATLREKNINERRLEAMVRHQERLSSLGQFAAGIAHEIRNPLATICLRLQMSQRAAQDSGVQRNCQIALDEIVRLDAMIDKLLYFSRPVRLQRERVDLSSLCSEIVEGRTRAAEERRIRMECRSDPSVFAWADPSQIRQVLDNVISNAMEAVESCPENQRRISCWVRSHAEWAEIAVEDSGAGFTLEAAEHAFDPFYTTKPRGTGLGLSIAWEILQAHEGQLQVANGESGGAIVILRLPVADDQTFRTPAAQAVGEDASHA